MRQARYRSERPVRARRGGFTLIELLVALVIAGVVALGAHAAVSLAMDVVTRRSAAAEPVLRGHGTRQMLEGWLRSAWLAGGPLVGSDRREGSFQIDELSFAVADGGVLFPGPARIRLWVDRDPTTARWGVVAEVLRSRGGAPHADTIVLAPRARELAIRYRVQLAERSVWVDSWASATQLPEAIELQIGGAAENDASSADAPLLYVPMIVPIGWRTR
jgi:prepilin-type N-terminal cleavage/methylation domain-containing protein